MGLLDGLIGGVLGSAMGGGAQLGNNPLGSLLSSLTRGMGGAQTAGQNSGQNTAQAVGLGNPAAGALLAAAMALVQQQGGLSGLLDKFRQSGLGQHADSWEALAQT